MNWLDIVGTLAGIFTTVAAIPQIKKVWETKEVEDISLMMVGTLMLGLGLWTVYGIGKNDIPIIVTNGISFLLNSTLFYLRLRFAD